LSEGKGLAALQAAGAMLQGNDPVRGIGAAGSAFATSYAPALAAKRKADQSLTEMNINLSKARRAEKMGLLKEADAYEQAAEKNKIAAFNAETTARKAGLTSLPSAMQAVRAPAVRAGATARPSTQAEGVAIYAAQFKAGDPTLSDAEANARGLEKYNRERGGGLAGIMAGVTGRGDVAAADDMRSRDEAAGRAGNDAVKLLQNRADYREAKDNDKRNGTNTAKAMETATRDAAEAAFYRSAPKAKGGDKTSTSKNPPPKPDISKVEGAPAGSSVGGYDSGKGYKILDSKGKHIGYIE